MVLQVLPVSVSPHDSLQILGEAAEGLHYRVQQAAQSRTGTHQ
jgi:hypothetical protein